MSRGSCPSHSMTASHWFTERHCWGASASTASLLRPSSLLLCSDGVVDRREFMAAYQSGVVQPSDPLPAHRGSQSDHRQGHAMRGHSERVAEDTIGRWAGSTGTRLQRGHQRSPELPPLVSISCCILSFPALECWCCTGLMPSHVVLYRPQSSPTITCNGARWRNYLHHELTRTRRMRCITFVPETVCRWPDHHDGSTDGRPCITLQRMGLQRLSRP